MNKTTWYDIIVGTLLVILTSYVACFMYIKKKQLENPIEMHVEVKVNSK